MKDFEGQSWELEKAIVRVLLESYPTFLTIDEIALILKVHPSFIKKQIEKLFQEKAVSKFDSYRYQLTRTDSALILTNETLVLGGEAIMDGQICKFLVSNIKGLFIKEHNSQYLNFPPI